MPHWHPVSRRSGRRRTHKAVVGPVLNQPDLPDIARVSMAAISRLVLDSDAPLECIFEELWVVEGVKATSVFFCGGVLTIEESKSADDVPRSDAEATELLRAQPDHAVTARGKRMRVEVLRGYEALCNTTGDYRVRQEWLNTGRTSECHMVRARETKNGVGCWRLIKVVAERNRGPRPDINGGTSYYTLHGADTVHFRTHDRVSIRTRCAFYYNGVGTELAGSRRRIMARKDGSGRPRLCPVPVIAVRGVPVAVDVFEFRAVHITLTHLDGSRRQDAIQYDVDATLWDAYDVAPTENGFVVLLLYSGHYHRRDVATCLFALLHYNLERKQMHHEYVTFRAFHDDRFDPHNCVYAGSHWDRIFYDPAHVGQEGTNHTILARLPAQLGFWKNIFHAFAYLPASVRALVRLLVVAARTAPFGTGSFISKLPWPLLRRLLCWVAPVPSHLQPFPLRTMTMPGGPSPPVATAE